MATVNLTLEAPDAAIPLLRRTLGVVLGEPTPTASETKDALERYIKRRLKGDMMQQKQFEAQLASAGDDSDGSVSW